MANPKIKWVDKLRNIPVKSFWTKGVRKPAEIVRRKKGGSVREYGKVEMKKNVVTMTGSKKYTS